MSYGTGIDMLWLRAINVFTSPQDVGDYTVSVGINDNPIWNGSIRNHYRPDGAAALLKRIVEQMEKEKVK